MKRHLRPLAAVCAAGCAAALVAASSVGAAQSYAWIYAGHSIQLESITHQPLAMSVTLASTGRSVSDASFVEDYGCKNGDSYSGRTELVDMPIGAGGVWGKKKTFDDGSVVNISGKLTRWTATVTVNSVDADGCSASATYKLTRGPGSYGGQTSQGYPVSVKLKGNKKAIGELTFYWKLSCTGASGKTFTHRETTRLMDVPLGQGGKFAKTGTYSYPFADTGVPFKVTYTLAGVVGAAKTTGRITASASAGENGSIYETCGKTTVGWTAASA